MTFFKTRYKVRQTDDMLFAIYRRKWWQPFYSFTKIAGYDLKAVLSFVPKDGVIV